MSSFHSWYSGCHPLLLRVIWQTHNHCLLFQCTPSKLISLFLPFCLSVYKYRVLSYAIKKFLSSRCVSTRLLIWRWLTRQLQVKRWKKTNNHVIHLQLSKKKTQKTWTWLLSTFRHVQGEYSLLAHSCQWSLLWLYSSRLVGFRSDRPPTVPPKLAQGRGSCELQGRQHHFCLPSTRSYYTALSNTKNNWPDVADQVRASMKASKWNVWRKRKKKLFSVPCRSVEFRFNKRTKVKSLRLHLQTFSFVQTPKVYSKISTSEKARAKERLLFSRD